MLHETELMSPLHNKGRFALDCLATQQQHLINSICFNKMHDSNFEIPSGVDQFTVILLLVDVCAPPSLNKLPLGPKNK